MTRTIPITRPYLLPFESNNWGKLYFDGDTGYVVVKDSNSLDITSDITMMSTINPFSFGATGFGRIFDKDNLVINNYLLTLRTTNNTFYAGIGTTITATSNNNAITPPSRRRTQHIVASFSDTDNIIYYYKNGELVGSPICNTSPVANNLDLYIGDRQNGTRKFFGFMYDAIIIAQTLTRPQIQDIMLGRILPTQFDCRLWHDYRLGHSLDLSGNGNHGVVNGNARFVSGDVL